MPDANLGAKWHVNTCCCQCLCSDTHFSCCATVTCILLECVMIRFTGVCSSHYTGELGLLLWFYSTVHTHPRRFTDKTAKTHRWFEAVWLLVKEFGDDRPAQIWMPKIILQYICALTYCERYIAELVLY